MEKRVNIIKYGENDPEDINNLQGYIAASLDHIVGDSLIAGSKFSGFAAQKTGPASISIGAGRLYKNGAVYALETPTAYDFTSQLPVAAKKIVIISAWGSEIDTDNTPRNVLILAESTQDRAVYQPQIVALTHARIVNLGASSGSESPDPSAPIINAGLLPVAKILLSPIGVESVTLFSENAAPNLEDAAARLSAFESWKNTAAPALTGLASDVARLSNDARNNPNQALIGRMLGRLAILDAKNGVPTNAADSSADFYLDPTTSDLAHAASNCQVSEGVRFADEAASNAALQIFNPLNPLAAIVGGVLFPAYDSVLRFKTGEQTGEAQISAYAYQTQTLVQLTRSRQRIRYGESFTRCTNADFWQSGRYDPIAGIFTLPNGETYKAALDATAGVYAVTGGGVSHIAMRLQQFWVDAVTEPYTDYQTTNSQITGAQVSETFPVGQDFWLHSVGVKFSKLDAAGPVTLILCEATSTGVSDPTRVIAQATLSRDALKLAPDETHFVFQTPVYLQAGKRYAVNVNTAANHFIATADGASYPNGMFFAIVGGTPIPDPTKHIALSIYACKFRQSIAAIDLQPLQLAGGIVAIDVLAGAIAPSSSSLTYEAQINGVWMALASVNVGKLNAGGALPALLPFRAVFSGTSDVMPCIDLLASNVKLSRPKTAYTHIWPVNGRTLPAPSAQIRVTRRYESFDAAFHTASCKLLTGASFATETAPSSWSDLIADTNALERTYVFNLGAAVSAIKFKSSGTTASALKTYHEAWIKDWVL